MKNHSFLLILIFLVLITFPNCASNTFSSKDLKNQMFSINSLTVYAPGFNLDEKLITELICNTIPVSINNKLKIETNGIHLDFNKPAKLFNKSQNFWIANYKTDCSQQADINIDMVPTPNISEIFKCKIKLSLFNSKKMEEKPRILEFETKLEDWYISKTFTEKESSSLIKFTKNFTVYAINQESIFSYKQNNPEKEGFLPVPSNIPVKIYSIITDSGEHQNTTPTDWNCIIEETFEKNEKYLITYEIDATNEKISYLIEKL